MFVVKRNNFNQLAKKNKFNAKSTVYNGVSYHSKEEAVYASELDFRLKAKEILNWERQKKIELNIYFLKIHTKPIITDTPALELKAKGIEFIHIANYYIDFVIYHHDKSIEYVEVKGCETDTWKMKWKLCEAIFKDHPTITLTLEKAYNTWRNYKPKK